MASERKGRTIVPDKKKLIIGLIAGALLCGISAVFFSVKAGRLFSSDLLLSGQSD